VQDSALWISKIPRNKSGKHLFSSGFLDMFDGGFIAFSVARRHYLMMF